ncbi:hypothetical protein [Escherichia coli]|uniref:hypothetical protein n=1 Tax=Escherichia coli TaxID=562 RepID=UPI0010AD6B29|nr:hypothetical protein [Escherichia coli]TJF18461.1 hypothetical protein C9196_25760 [Escherichia coli]
MKKIIFLYFFLFFCLLTGRAYARCNLYWVLNDIPRVAEININATGEQSYFKKNFYIQVGGKYYLKDVKQDYFFLPGLPMSGGVRYWIQYDNNWVEIPGGLKYRISSSLELPNAEQITGYRTVVSPLQKHTWEWEEQACPSQGSYYYFSAQNIAGMSLEVDSQNAYPGIYNIKLPLRVAYEENKGGLMLDDGWKYYPSLLLQEPLLRSNVNVNINNACTFYDKKLDVDFGNITDKDVLNGTEKIVSFAMNCTRQVIFKMSIEGGNKGKNATSCGKGICILTFNNGSDSISGLRSSGYGDIGIHVKLKSGEVFTGRFQSSMVLKIFIN